jgi:glucose uptake protein GlcU
MTEDYLVGLLSGLIIGFGLGAAVQYRAFHKMVVEKANTGIRLEAGGRLFTVEEVEYD